MSELSDLVRGVVALEPDSQAFEFRGEWRTWGSVAQGMAAIDAALRELGFGASVRVGVLLKNHGDLPPVVLEVVCSQRCLVTLNGASPPQRLVEEIDKLALPVLVGLAGEFDHPDVRAALVRNGTVGLELAPGGAIVTPVGAPAVTSDPARREAPGIGIEMLTSGTTGTPKRVPLKTKNFERMVMETAVYERGRQGETGPKLRSGVQLLTVPLSHIGGVLALFTVVSAGRKACILEKFAVDAYVDAIARHRPKVASAPPSALRMILDRDVPKDALSSLVVFRTGTAPLDPDLADAFEARYGIPVLQNYGATEFAGGVAGWTIEDHRALGRSKRGSVGRVHDGVDARIVDPETGAPLEFGAVGLLELKAAHLGDGSWVRTTDLARLDADRFLWIDGRFDNAIIRGGFKVFPDDVVRALETHPAIREASVIGIADPRLGQAPVAAYIVKAGHAAPTPDDLKAHLKDRLLPYQVPVQFLQLEDFPRTPSMKVSQPDLRALFAQTAAA